MKNSYSLLISVDEKYIPVVDKILGIKSNIMYSWWEYEIEENEETIDYINLFLDILENKYDILEQVGVSRNMISIWRYYEYDQQCNMEFSPQVLKRMGENGITFCISCWDTGEEPKIIDRVLN